MAFHHHVKRNDTDASVLLEELAGVSPPAG
jgi:hypothetical protein